MIVLTKSGMRQNIAAFRQAMFFLKRLKNKEFAAKKISEWRKLTKKMRRLFRTYEKIYGK